MLITNYNTNTLNQFDSVLRYSKLLDIIDDAESSILIKHHNFKIKKNIYINIQHQQIIRLTFLTHYIIHILVIIQVLVVY